MFTQFQDKLDDLPGLLSRKNGTAWELIPILLVLVFLGMTTMKVSATSIKAPACQPEMLCTSVIQGQLTSFSPQLVVSDTTLVHTGPGLDYLSYGYLPAGANSLVNGVSQDGNWWAIPLPTTIAPDGLGWVSATTITVENAQKLPDWLAHCDRMTYCGFVLAHSPQYVPVRQPSSTAPRFGVTQP